MAYDWDNAKIERHSINKLKLIRAYISAYLGILGKGGYKRTTFPFCFVDGFCGGGSYESPEGKRVLGSPLIALESALEFEIAVNHPKHSVETKFMFHFIDEDKKAIDHLRYELGEYKQKIPNQWKVNAVLGEFEAQVDQVIQSIRHHSRSQRAIFLLDQYGYSQVKFPTLWKIMHELNNAEIILNISTDWLADFANHEHLEQQLSKLGAPSASINRHLKALKNSKDNSSMKKSQMKRMLCQKFAVEEIVKGLSIAQPYYSPYCIRSVRSNKSFVLLHLSRSLRAKEVMLTKQYEVGKSGGMIHEGPGGLNALEFKELHRQSYLFEEVDRKNSLRKLEKELPNYLHSRKKIAARDLYAEIANRGPNSKEMIYEALKSLIDHKIITATTPKGNSIRNKVSDNTEIKLTPQQSLFLPNK